MSRTNVLILIHAMFEKESKKAKTILQRKEFHYFGELYKYYI